MSAATRRATDLVAISVSIAGHLPRAALLVEHLREADGRVPIVLGGQAFAAGGGELAGRGVLILSLEALEDLVDEWGG